MSRLCVFNFKLFQVSLLMIMQLMQMKNNSSSAEIHNDSSSDSCLLQVAFFNESFSSLKFTHWNNICFHLFCHEGDASIDKNLVSDGISWLCQNIMSTICLLVKATGIRKGEILSNGGVAEISVASEIVVAATAVKVSMELIPLGCDPRVFTVPDQITLNIC